MTGTPAPVGPPGLTRRRALTDALDSGAVVLGA